MKTLLFETFVSNNQNTRGGVKGLIKLSAAFAGLKCIFRFGLSCQSKFCQSLFLYVMQPLSFSLLFLFETFNFIVDPEDLFESNNSSPSIHLNLICFSFLAMGQNTWLIKSGIFGYVFL